MLIDFTSEELKALKALEDSYEKLIRNQEEKILELRPDDPEPDEEEYRKIQDSRIPEPVELRPEPIEYTEDDTPVYSKEAMEVYRNTPEYKAYIADNKRANDAVAKLWDNWYAAGSQEWKEARTRLEKLRKEFIDARSDFYRKVEDRYFNSLGGDLNQILADAQSQVDRLIVSNYRYYEKKSKETSFSARNVRVQDDGSFLLDTTEERETLRKSISRHIEALKSDPTRIDILYRYIEDALQKSELVGDTGERGGTVSRSKYDGELVIRPEKYITTVDRLSILAFSNELTRPDDADGDALWNIRLDKKGKVFVGAAIDYSELLKSGDIKGLPELSRDDYDVHDAIISQLYAGNRTMSYDMIYRAMTGKVSGKITVPDDARDIIDDALAKFKSRITIEYHAGTDESGNEVAIRINEPIVTFTQATALINGRRVRDAIVIPQDTRFDPPLLRWARFNRNEIDTRDITLLDVPKLNNGKDSRAIKMCLYRRLIRMRNTFERKKGGKYELDEKQRTIRYDYVYKELGDTEPNVDKRKRIKSKIDRCMKYWESKGFIAGYVHKRDGKGSYYAVEVRFLEPKK